MKELELFLRTMAETPAPNPYFEPNGATDVDMEEENNEGVMSDNDIEQVVEVCSDEEHPTDDNNERTRRSAEVEAALRAGADSAGVNGDKEAAVRALLNKTLCSLRKEQKKVKRTLILKL